MTERDEITRLRAKLAQAEVDYDKSCEAVAKGWRDEDELLASFLLYDGCASIGRRLPIWGGRNTWTEHAFGRLARRLTRNATKT